MVVREWSSKPCIFSLPFSAATGNETIKIKLQKGLGDAYEAVNYTVCRSSYFQKEVRHSKEQLDKESGTNCKIAPVSKRYL